MQTAARKPAVEPAGHPNRFAVLCGIGREQQAAQSDLQADLHRALKTQVIRHVEFPDKPGIDCAGFQVEAVDPTGAGDCFDAGFVVGLLEGKPLEEVGRLANACGALGATRKGPMEGAMWRADVDAMLQT